MLAVKRSLIIRKIGIVVDGFLGSVDRRFYVLGVFFLVVVVDWVFVFV